MSTNSTNYGFVKPSLTDSANITVLSNTIESIDNVIKANENKNLVQTASGNGTTITLTLPTLVNGYQVTFIASANNNGSATTINVKNVFKPGTTTPPVLVKDKGYKVYYNSNNDCFFCLANASGNTVSSHVLAGDTFSNDIDTDLVGTMPNRGAVSSALNCGASYTIPLGYHNGLGTITANSLASQTIASATANQILNTITAWINGVKVTGNMPNNGAVANTIASASGTYTIPQGYHNGSGVVTAPSLATVTSAGTVTNANQIVNGYVAISDGVTYTGTANPCQKASGTVFCNVNSSVTVSLPFTPNYVAGTVEGAIVSIAGFAFNDGTSTFGGGNNDGGVQLLTNGFRFSINRNSNGTVHWYAYLA